MNKKDRIYNKYIAFIIVLNLLMCGFVQALQIDAETAARADEIIRKAEFNGGIIVHLGCGDGKLITALHKNKKFLIRGLDTSSENINKSRKYINSLDLYGKVSVDIYDGSKLPFVDNLINLIIVEPSEKVSKEEIMRVLAPLGKAYINENGEWKFISKSWPEEIDEWPQYLHGSDNNAVARDSVVGPPRHMQWANEPAWGRSHMAIPTVICMVSARGRLFSIEDWATPENPFLPGKFSLIARDAFNGILLWKYNIPVWEPVTRYIKDIPVQLQRRLAAIGDVVYCTPGIDAPITVFDAVTGKITKTYNGTEKTQEFVYNDGIIYAVIGDRMNAARYNIVKIKGGGNGKSLGGSDPSASFDGTGFNKLYTRETRDKTVTVCMISAIDVKTGEQVWKKSNIQNYIGGTLAIKGNHAAYQVGNGIICLDSKTGKKVWTAGKQIKSNDGTEPNVLLLSDEMLYAQSGKMLFAHSLENGKVKWTAPIHNCYEKSADLFLVGTNIWTSGEQKPPVSRSSKTGIENLRIMQKRKGPMKHDRCYRNHITEKYYINSKTGGSDFVLLDGKKEFAHEWVRGACGFGVLPCNGFLYSTPYSCQCSIVSLLKNINALYTEKDLKTPGQKIEIIKELKLIKGPSYGKLPVDKTAAENDWPAYRHDITRSGKASSAISSTLKHLWKFQVKTGISAPIIADNKVYVSDIDAHTLYALNKSDGNVLWSYTAGGRIDSPPTYYNGLLLFGSRDGWMHCVKADDGSLVWQFKDLPDKMISAFNQLESAWPLNGSTLVKDGVVYFAAGRSSFLDGGIFLYGLNPETGEIKYSQNMYGPYNPKTGMSMENTGFKSDILVADEAALYLRYEAFNPDLTKLDSNGNNHLIPSAGFLDGTPQHRTYWIIDKRQGNVRPFKPHGDILVMDGSVYYLVEGFPVARHSYFDPRLKGYKLAAARIATQEDINKIVATAKKRVNTKKLKSYEIWTTHIPITGKAMVLANDIIFIAGNSIDYRDDIEKMVSSYEGKSGGVLWLASKTDGKKLVSYNLDAAPKWDGMAVAGKQLYISLNDGSIHCYSE